MKAVIGLGTNIGDRILNLKEALGALELLPGTKVLRTSSVYETKPYGFSEQPDFLNTVAEVETPLSPHALLGGCLGIEAGMGRVRAFKNGPRIIDMDLLLAENFSEQSSELTVPHPEICNRSFVLVPLMELYDNGEAFGLNFLQAYEKHPKNDIKKYAVD